MKMDNQLSGFAICEERGSKGKSSFFDSENLYSLLNLARTLCFKVLKYMKTL